MPPQKIRKISLEKSPEAVEKDLEKYCQQAVEKGATDARKISTSQIVVDDRVVLKCHIPKCFGFGTSAHCPPHVMSPGEMKKIVTMYRSAVVFKLEINPGVVVRDRETISERVEAYKTVFDIVDTLESNAFYDGHYLAVGFGAGSCKSTFCHDVECAVLKGEKCRRSLKARPSMEAVGIDCYRLATELGWNIYPIGSDALASSVPYGTLMGLVLIE
jgi:predicted metal-binding protein